MPVVALTATATKETISAVAKRLNLKSPKIIALPPDRPNISYSVMQQPDLETIVDELARNLCQKGITYPKTVVFCRSYSVCAQMYMQLSCRFGSFLTFPVDMPNLQQFRVVNMFTRASTLPSKKQIISSFSNRGSTLRVLIATTAFGMGIDCPDIRSIVHWGAPSDVETYVQESGCCGRDGLPSTAVLYVGRHSKHDRECMREYCANDIICRRSFLFKTFISGSLVTPVIACKCCDVCLPLCSCDICS